MHQVAQAKVVLRERYNPLFTEGARTMHTFFGTCDLEATLVRKGTLISIPLKGVELTHPCSMHDAVALHLIREYTDLDACSFDTPGSATRLFMSGEIGNRFGRDLERAFKGLCIVPPSAEAALNTLDSDVDSLIDVPMEQVNPGVDPSDSLKPGGVYFEGVRAAYDACIVHKVTL